MISLYYYRAVSLKGGKSRGFLFASDLRNLKYVTSLRDLRLQSGKKLPKWSVVILLFLFKIRRTYRTGLHARGIFFRQLANLIESGLSIQKVAETMIKQEKNRYFLKALVSLQENLVLGRDLALSVQEAFDFLPDEYRLLLSGCKDTKSMRQVFMAVASVSEKKQSIAFAIIRMTIVFILALIITVFVFIFYVKFWLYDDRLGFLYRHQTPPYLYETFFQIFSGRAFFNWRYLALVLGALALVALIRFQPKIFLYWKKLVLHIPVIGEGIRAQVATSLFFYLDLQISSGITLQKALRTAVGLMKKTPYHDDLNRFSEDLFHGRSIEDALERTQIFSDDEKSLLRSSLTSGALQDSLKVIRQYLDNKLKTRMLVVREFVRFIFLFALLILYAWALYTRFYVTMGYAF